MSEAGDSCHLPTWVYHGKGVTIPALQSAMAVVKVPARPSWQRHTAVSWALIHKFTVRSSLLKTLAFV